jgi:DNA-binding response OmpR family regulator
MKSGEHILIVDDETSIRQTMARILLKAGFEVTTVTNAQESLAMIHEHAFDLAYLDIRLPDMNGLEVLSSMRNQCPDMPIILFTAQPDVHSAVEALRRGATDYLMKPLKPEVVIQRTRDILEEQRKKKRRRAILQEMEQLQTELDALDGTPTPEPRQLPADPDSDRFLRRGSISLDLHARRAMIYDRVVSLAPTSFDYLLVLARHSPNVVNYQTLVAEAQGYESVQSEYKLVC